MDVRRPLVEGDGRSFDGSGQPIRRESVRAAGCELVRSHAQVVEERELQRARPGPELAHREGRHRLEGADEPLKPLRFEPAGADSDQLERERVRAREPGELVGGDARQPLEERGREIVMDVARGGRDDVEVVEQPFGRRRHAFMPRVLRELRVDVAERAHMVVDLPQVGAATAAAPRRNREQRRQTPGVLLEQLDTQQFPATRQRARSCEYRMPHELFLCAQRLTPGNEPTPGHVTVCEAVWCPPTAFAPVRPRPGPLPLVRLRD